MAFNPDDFKDDGDGIIDIIWSGHGGGGGVTSVGTTAPLSGGPITSTGNITTSMNTNKLIGRGTASTGVMEEITLGTNLSLSGTTLNASGGGGTPGGLDTQVQFNDSDTFGGNSALTFLKDTGNSYYVVSAISFSPTSLTGGATSVSLSDDSVSSAIPLPFTVEFYGVSKSNIYIGSNGNVGFTNTSMANPGGKTIPGGGNPKDQIFLFYTDLDPGAGGTIKYQNFGTTPNQIFIVEYANVPLFGTGDILTSQVKIFEADNHIEIHTTTADDSTGYNATQGIYDSAGTLATVFDQSRNNEVFSLTNDAISFDIVNGGTLSLTGENIVIGTETVVGSFEGYGTSSFGTPDGTTDPFSITSKFVANITGNKSANLNIVTEGVDDGAKDISGDINITTGSGYNTQGESGDISIVTGDSLDTSGISGNIVLRTGDSTVGTSSISLSSPTTIVGDQDQNVALVHGTSFGGGSGVIGIHTATTVPNTNPTNGGILYVEAGALKYRGSSGTVTTLGNA